MDIGTHKLDELDQKELEFKTGFGPAARFFYYPFVLALLRNRRYRQPGWETSWAELRTKKPWATPGSYLRKSMLLALARQVDDVAESDVETLFSDQGTFGGEGLTKRKEDEVARRVFIAHGHGKGDDPEELEDAIDKWDNSDSDDDDYDEAEDENDRDWKHADGCCYGSLDTLTAAK